MPDDQTTNPPIVPTTDPVAPVSDAPVAPTPSPIPETPAIPAIPTTPSEPTATEAQEETTNPEHSSSAGVPSDVLRRINESHNVLIALSGDPSVDELSAAIGLSLYLDKLGKRATAIYSGSTPNALEFLKPEETFEPTADTLQDFVIALNKEKADHLRYKLDGDYVKIYITPYKTRISEEDLDFSYGDFNVDLVLSLDVSNGIDLDAALREHGRIMHDAVIINITTGNPGKFGEIEWSDKSASSISEMVAKLLYGMGDKAKIEKEEATAFLTGIVAATNRFSNAKTSPETMKISSRLMESGANQQLISKNITPDVDNEMYSSSETFIDKSTPKEKKQDPTKLDIEHGNEKDVDETKEVSDTITEKESTLLDDLKAAEESLAKTGTETTPDLSNSPVRIGGVEEGTKTEETKPEAEETKPEVEETKPEESTASSSGFMQSEPTSNMEPSEPILPPVVDSAEEKDSTAETTEPTPITNTSIEPTSESTTPESEPKKQESESSSSESTDQVKAEKVVAPPSDLGSTPTDTDTDKYSKMLEDALNEVNASAPQMDTASIGEPIDMSSSPAPSGISTETNPAATSAPSVPSNPEINGVPEINFMPMPGEEVLPPPPTPPIDMNSNLNTTPESSSSPVTPIQPAAPVSEPEPTSLGSQPAMQDQVYAPQASDPSAFKIPGM